MKKYLITFLLLLMAILPVFAQDAIPYQVVQQKPTFNGGDERAFLTWVNQRIIYPEEARAQGLKGRVIVQFIIETDGSVTNVSVIKGVHKSLDDEAVRVVSSSPKWEPGREDGKAVRVYYSMPFVFRYTAQAPEPASAPEAIQKADDDEEAIPFQLVERKPSFEGGDANEFSKWVNSHLASQAMWKILEKAPKSMEWRVTLQFTVETDGSVDNVKVLKSSGEPAFDKEAIRVVTMSPKWVPGYQKGQAVKVTYTFPVIMQRR